LSVSRYDVIVVGGGTAGIPAALGAAERGLSVAVVEAAEEIGGTLHLSTASISAAGTAIQARNGIADSTELHYADYLRINHGTGRAPLVRRWIDEAAQTVEWLQSIGWRADPDTAVFAPEHDLYSVPRTYRSHSLGLGVAAAYRDAAGQAIAGGARLEILTNTRFTAFLTHGDAVTGIMATQGDRTITLHADAVILTTGGFSNSQAKWQHFHGFSPLRYARTQSNGDGIDAVRAIGGATWFEDYLLPNFGATRDIGGPPSAWIHSTMLVAIRPPWEVYVNLEGERFMAEDEPHIFARELAVKQQTQWGFWVIYDQGIVDASPPFLKFTPEIVEAKFSGPDEDYVRADSIAALAAGTGLPTETLAQTIAYYNQGQAVGSDMLGRQHLPAPIATGPFYAVRHYGYAISSYPGVRVDDDLQAVRADGTPIPGLYAAGEAIGIGFLGLGFMSGSIVSAAVTFGRRLGREVLARAAVPA
jgi:fumarate reductase flavoprotein subunit